jgi:hypothetical protein
VGRNACASDFETQLGVYTGDSLEGLTKVTSNHNGCAGGSKVTFYATKNATYRMLVDGYNGKQGEFTLRVSH